METKPLAGLCHFASYAGTGMRSVMIAGFIPPDHR
jgi:hypothetical protein